MCAKGTVCSISKRKKNSGSVILWAHLFMHGMVWLYSQSESSLHTFTETISFFNYYECIELNTVYNIIVYN